MKVGVSRADDLYIKYIRAISTYIICRTRD